MARKCLGEGRIEISMCCQWVMRASPEMPATFRSGAISRDIEDAEEFEAQWYVLGPHDLKPAERLAPALHRPQGICEHLRQSEETSGSQVRVVSIAFNVLAEVLSPPLPFF
jgi:hypothetical protein